RHTRFSRDWSSDVCSSDLKYIEATAYTKYFFEALYNYPFLIAITTAYLVALLVACYRFYFKNLSLDSAIVVKKENYKYYDLNFRSEERRVGKECRNDW